MDEILESIGDAIHDFLVDLCGGIFIGIFDDANAATGSIATEVGLTPSQWNNSIFTMIQNLSNNVIIPIAGMIITFVLCYELITAITEKNNMHDIDTFLFFKYIFKAFLTEKKSSELLKKIESLSSVHEAKQIQRQVYVTNRVKAMNERIYISVDVIHRAIAEGKKIKFKYFDYDLQKKKKYRDGVRICSPYALAWDDERYYMIAFYDRRDCISNFRIDRMESVEILEDKAKEKPKNFIVADYMNSSFSMFSGDTQDVKLRFDNQLINAVIDRFGKNITIVADGDSHFTVRVQVKAEHPEPFFGWLFQFGTMAEIVEPCELRERYIAMLKAVTEKQSNI